MTPGGKYTYFAASDQLIRDVKHRYTVHDFLARHCGTEASSGSCLCPVHREVENKRSFHVYTSSDGHEMWKCFGDCDDAGDVIKLAKLVWNVSWKEAKNRLATELGLDPKGYRAIVKRPGGKPSGGWDSPLADEEAGEEEVSGEAKSKVRKAPPELRTKVLKGFEDWANYWVLYENPDVQDFVRATARMLLGAGVEPEIAAASLHNPATVTTYPKYDHVLGEVLNVFKRIQDGEPVRGRQWLQDNLGTTALFDLASLLSRQLPEVKLAELAKSFIGFGLIADKAEAHLKHATWLLGVHDQLVREEGGLERYKKILPQLRRPVACCRLGMKKTGYMGRDLGKIKLVCTRVTCPYCSMLRTLSEYEVLQEKWGGIKTEISVVEVTGIPDPKCVDEIRQKYVSRCGYRKLALLGYRNGLPCLSWLILEDGGQTMVASSVNAWRSVNRKKDPRIEGVKIKRFSVSVEEATELAFASRLSWHLHAKDLIEMRRTEELVAWLTWARGKHTARSSCKTLSWVSKEELQEHIKSKCGDTESYDLLPFEIVTYTLYYLATGYVLGTKERNPFGYDEASGVAANHHPFQNHLASLAA